MSKLNNIIKKFFKYIFTKKDYINLIKQKPLPLPLPNDSPSKEAIKIDFHEGSEFMLQTKKGREERQKAVIATKEKYKRIFEEKQKSDIEKRKVELYELKEKLKSIYSEIEEVLNNKKS